MHSPLSPKLTSLCLDFWRTQQFSGLLRCSSWVIVLKSDSNKIFHFFLLLFLFFFPFHIRYYTFINAILPNHPTLSLSLRVQKSTLHICVSIAVWLPIFASHFNFYYKRLYILNNFQKCQKIFSEIFISVLD